MWAIMYVVHAGMPANVPQVTSISLNELLKIPLSSEIEAVAEVEKLEHTESSVILWVRIFCIFKSHLESGMLL